MDESTIGQLVAELAWPVVVLLGAIGFCYPLWKILTTSVLDAVKHERDS